MIRTSKIRLADLRKGGGIFPDNLGDPVKIEKAKDTFFILTNKGYELWIDQSVVEELAKLLEEDKEKPKG